MDAVERRRHQVATGAFQERAQEWVVDRLEPRQEVGPGPYKNGLKDGTWRQWDEHGHLRSTGSWKDGRKDGKWVTETTDDAGSMRTKGAYSDGLKQGAWTTYLNGKPYKRITYDHGTRSGRYVSWVDHVEGDYLDGRRQGTWTVWWDGDHREKREKRHYDHGSPTGSWRFWTLRGKLEMTFEHRDGKLVRVNGKPVKACPPGTTQELRYDPPGLSDTLSAACVPSGPVRSWQP